MGNIFFSSWQLPSQTVCRLPRGRGVKNTKPKYNFFVITTKKAPILSHHRLTQCNPKYFQRGRRPTGRGARGASQRNGGGSFFFFPSDGLKLRPAPSGTARVFLESVFSLIVFRTERYRVRERERKTEEERE